jgi:hypothetical protein
MSFHVFNGVESMPIKSCGWNAGWVRDCFSESTLTRIGSQSIICSGVSVGTTELVIKYIQMMSDIISGKDSSVTAHQFPRCERNGVDQGVHNVLVYSNAIDHLQTWGQSDGPVANMQARLAVITTDFKVVNRKGGVYAVVHQYDRFPDLQRHLFGKVRILLFDLL